MILLLTKNMFSNPIFKFSKALKLKAAQNLCCSAADIKYARSVFFHVALNLKLNILGRLLSFTSSTPKFSFIFPGSYFP